MQFRRLITALAIAAVAVLVPTASASAAQASANSTPRYTCTYDQSATVIVDWVRVRTNHSTSAGATGQLPRGAAVRYCAYSLTAEDGIMWVYGYGYNGSTKLTGWMDVYYLS